MIQKVKVNKNNNKNIQINRWIGRWVGRQIHRWIDIQIDRKYVCERDSANSIKANRVKYQQKFTLGKGYQVFFVLFLFFKPLCKFEVTQMKCKICDLPRLWDNKEKKYMQRRAGKYVFQL